MGCAVRARSDGTVRAGQLDPPVKRVVTWWGRVLLPGTVTQHEGFR